MNFLRRLLPRLWLSIALTMTSESLGDSQPRLLFPDHPPTKEVSAQILVLDSIKTKPPEDKKDCFELVGRGRRLSGSSVNRSLVSSNIEHCETECNKSDNCTAFTFGFLYSNGTGGDGRCDMTFQDTLIGTSARLDTIPQGSFNLYVKHHSCRTARILSEKQPLLASHNYPIQENRIEFGDHFGQIRKGCFQLAAVSRGLDPNHVRLSFTAYLLQDCMDLCSRETEINCLGFSYRAPTSSGDAYNCHLTDKDTRSLDLYGNDFYPSTTYDFYERISQVEFKSVLTSRLDNCSTGVGFIKENANRDGQAELSRTDCYSILRRGAKHFTYRGYKTTDSSDRCAEECEKTSYCNTFSYRYSSDTSTDIGNCLLSDLSEGFVRDPEDIKQDSAWSMYSLSSDSSCTGSPRPTERPTTEVCHHRERMNYRHSYFSIDDRYRVGGLPECSWQCRQLPSCRSFSFRILEENREENCFLSFKTISEAVASGDVVSEQYWDLYSRINSAFCLQNQQPSDCYRMESKFYRHYSTVTLHSRPAQSLMDCATICQKDTACKTFSYSTQEDTFGRPQENCILSGKDFRDISVNRDLVQDADWNVYSVGQERCQYQESETDTCFERVNQGVNLDRYTVISYHRAKTVEECANICENKQRCKFFSFRIAERERGSNCYLSDILTLTGNTIPDREWDIFRVNSHNGANGSCKGDYFDPDKGRCFSVYRKGFKYYSSVVRDVASVESSRECAERCSLAGYCRSFSYLSSNRIDRDNCLLSGLDVFKVLENTDLVRDPDWQIFELTCNLTSPCWQLDRRGFKLDNLAVERTTVASSLSACSTICGRAKECVTFAYSQNQNANCQLSRTHVTDLTKSHLRVSSGWDIYEKLYGTECKDGSSPPGPDFRESCHERVRSGAVHRPGFVMETLSVANVDECSTECGKRTKRCNTFSYSYWAGSSSKYNCLLSNVLSPSPEEITADSNWDIFIFSSSRPECLGQNDDSNQDGHWNSECMERLSRDARHNPSTVKERLRASSLIDCGNKCRSEHFCGSFSFGYQRGDCYLSRLKVTEITSLDFSFASGWDLYVPIFNPGCLNDTEDPQSPGCYRIALSNFRLRPSAALATYSVRDKNECELRCGKKISCTGFSFTALYGTINCLLISTRPHLLNPTADLIRDVGSDVYEKLNRCADNDHNPSDTFIKCSNIFRTSSKLERKIVLNTYNTNNPAECEQICLRTTRYRCRFFAFHYDSKSSTNCHLSDIDTRDLTTDSRYLVSDRNWDVFERTQFSEECRDFVDHIGFDSGKEMDTDLLHEDLNCYSLYKDEVTFHRSSITQVYSVRNEEECSRKCDFHKSGQKFSCNGFAFSYRIDQSNCVLSEFSKNDDNSELQYDRNFAVWRYDNRNPNCAQSYTGSWNSSNEYTVSGERCLAGGCKLNPDVNYWYCEILGDEGWDYCCRPNHRCGYHKGYDYPWCYVGESGFDQWRPCNKDRARIDDRNLSQLQEKALPALDPRSLEDIS